MQNTINRALKFLIVVGLGIITFIPLYVSDGLFFPFITGKAFAFRIIVEIIFALWLILLLRERGTSEVGTEKSVAPKINWITIGITAFTLITLIADLVGLNPLRSIWSNFERMEGWITIVHLWAFFIVLSSVLNTRENWHKFLNTFLVAAGLVGIYGLTQYFGWAEIHQGSTRVDASLGNSAYMAVYMLTSAFIALYMAVSNISKKGMAWMYTVVFVVFSFVMFQTATRGTILGWIAAILVALAIYAIFGRKEKGQSNRSRAICGGIILAMVIAGLLFYANRDAKWIQANHVLKRLATISISDTKTQARGFIWPMAIEGVFENPKNAIIGVGQENFNYIFNSHYDPKMWSHEQWFDRAHSVFLDWLVAGGLITFLLYVSLYVISIVYIFKSNLNIAEKSVLTAFVVGYGIHNIFVFDNQTSYVTFFIFLAFVHSLRPGKIPAMFRKEGKITENYETVRDYIFVPVIVIAFLIVLYTINIRVLQANQRLIVAMRACATGEDLKAEHFANALKLDQTAANQEIREQLYSCATNVIVSPLPLETKTEFYNLVEAEAAKHIEENPNDARAHLLVGGFYNSIGYWADAEKHLTRAVELSPGKQSMVFELAFNYLNNGKFNEALAILEDAYEASTDNTDARLAYIVGLISAGQEKKAQEIFGSQPELFEDERIINAYNVTKQYSRSIELYKRLLEKNPNQTSLYSGLASVYLMNNQRSLAIQTLNSAKAKFPELASQVDTLIKEIQEGRTF